MRNRHAFVPPILDPLEGRVVLSPGVTATALVVAVVPFVQSTRVFVLQGTVKGTAIPNPRPSSLSWDQLLYGTGNVSPLGKVGLVGSLSIRSGEPTFYDGTVTLSGLRGGLRARIHGIVGGPSGPPVHLPYEILSGWGAFRNASGKGQVVFTQGITAASRTSFTLTFGPATTH